MFIRNKYAIAALAYISLVVVIFFVTKHKVLPNKYVISKYEQRTLLASCEYGVLSTEQDYIAKYELPSLGTGYPKDKCKELLQILGKDNDLEK